MSSEEFREFLQKKQELVQNIQYNHGIKFGNDGSGWPLWHKWSNEELESLQEFLEETKQLRRKRIAGKERSTD